MPSSDNPQARRRGSSDRGLLPSLGAAEANLAADMTVAPRSVKRRGMVVRAGWTGLGCVAVGLGGIGIVVPGLPTTVFFIIAAWAFAKSSRRLEAWVLGLPRIGPMVQDYRAGHGMPRRTKILAATMIVLFVVLSAWVLDGWLVPTIVIAAGAVGLAVVLRVPTGVAAPAQDSTQASTEKNTSSSTSSSSAPPKSTYS